MYGSKDAGRSWRVTWTAGGGESAKDAIIKSNLLHFDRAGRASALMQPGPQLMNYGADLGVYPHNDILPGRYYSSDKLYPSAAGAGGWAFGMDSPS